jgi:hypothetical protein
MLLALFDDIDPAANGIEELRKLGVSDDEMNVISGVPIKESILGRPQQWSNVPRLALGGAMAGLLLGLFLAVGAPLLYPLNQGGQPIVPIPPSIVVLFEMTMLGLLASTFLGVFLDSYFPSYRPMEYVPEISDGMIAILFSPGEGAMSKYAEALTRLGAVEVKPVEAQQL